MTQMTQLDVEKTLSLLTLDEKINLLSGRDNWRTHEVSRLGIPSLMVSMNPLKRSLHTSTARIWLLPRSLQNYSLLIIFRHLMGLMESAVRVSSTGYVYILNAT